MVELFAGRLALSVSGIHRMRGGYQPLPPGMRCAIDMRKRFRFLRRRMGKRSSLSGWVASVVLWFLRPLSPAWRERVRRVRQEMIARAMPRYTRAPQPPHVVRPPPPPAPPRKRDPSPTGTYRPAFSAQEAMDSFDRAARAIERLT